MRTLVATLVAFAALSAGADAATLSLEKCVKGKFQCGRLQVPLDYGKPDGRKVSIPVTRIRAKQPKRRIGTLFVNYGGPGGDAVETTQEFGVKVFKTYRRRFDIVAFDPRGTGGSRPALNCEVDQERVGLYRHPHLTPSSYDRDAALAKASRYATRCARRNALLAPHVSTANVARDMDAVRDAFGVREVTYFGFSYGTLLGATYAALFPDRVRSLVLDGPVDPAAYLTDPVSDIQGQTAGFEDALKRYFAACKRSRRACRWSRGRSPRAAYDRLVRRADRRPLKVRPRATQGNRRRVDGDVMNFAVAGDLYAKQLWPEISAALDQASRGNGTLLRIIADAGYGRRKDGSYSPDGDRYFMIGGAEQRWPREPEPYESAGAAAFAKTRDFIFNTGYSLLDYSRFTPRDEDAFLGPFTLAAAAPTPLVVATTHDPATPYDGGRALVSQLGRGRLLTMRGDGHTAYGGQSPCVDRAIDAYVIRGRLPAAGKTCRQRVPFPPRKKASTSAASVEVTAADIIARRGR